MSPKTSNNGFVFPLYLYPDPNKVNYEPTDAPGSRRPNLAPEFVTELTQKLGLAFVPDGQGDLSKTVGPEDIFYYTYAVFHAPSYRKRYADFLKQDFPRVPPTKQLELFKTLAILGQKLIKLHLMELSGPDITSYPEAGLNVVGKLRYQAPKDGEPGRVHINPSQYFEGVPQEVWDFHVGGYQVCEKWLKDRKGLELSYDDIEHYRHLVSVLSETLKIMNRIDETITAHGGWPLT